MTRQKEAIAKNDKSKVNMTKLQFTKDVWEEVDRHQQEELKLAICGLSDEYELADVAAHLEVTPDEWFEMTVVERKAYAHKFDKLSVDKVIKGKTIRGTLVPNVEYDEYKEFSCDVKVILQSLKSWTDGLVATIVKEAEVLLNAKDAIQKMPSLEPTSNLPLPLSGRGKELPERHVPMRSLR